MIYKLARCGLGGGRKIEKKVHTRAFNLRVRGGREATKNLQIYAEPMYRTFISLVPMCQ